MRLLLLWSEDVELSLLALPPPPDGEDPAGPDPEADFPGEDRLLPPPAVIPDPLLLLLLLLPALLLWLPPPAPPPPPPPPPVLSPLPLCECKSEPLCRLLRPLALWGLLWLLATWGLLRLLALWELRRV